MVMLIDFQKINSEKYSNEYSFIDLEIDNNIRLLRIPYTEFKNINSIITEYINNCSTTIERWIIYNNKTK